MVYRESESVCRSATLNWRSALLKAQIALAGFNANIDVDQHLSSCTNSSPVKHSCSVCVCMFMNLLTTNLAVILH